VQSQIPDLNPRNAGKVFSIVGENLCESLLFYVEGIVCIHEIDVRMDIEIKGHKEKWGFGTVKIRRIQDLFNFRSDIRHLQFVKGFQRPDDLGDDQQTRRQFDLAAQGITKECLCSLGFRRVVVGQKTENTLMSTKRLAMPGYLLGYGLSHRLTNLFKIFRVR